MGPVNRINTCLDQRPEVQSTPVSRRLEDPLPSRNRLASQTAKVFVPWGSLRLSSNHILTHVLSSKLDSEKRANRGNFMVRLTLCLIFGFRATYEPILLNDRPRLACAIASELFVFPSRVDLS